MFYHIEPPTIRFLRLAIVALFGLLVLIYILVNTILALNSPVLQIAETISTALVPPTLVLSGKRSFFANSTIYVQGLYIPSTNGVETTTPLLSRTLTPITVGNEVTFNLPPAFNDALNGQNTIWWLLPDDQWRFSVPMSSSTEGGGGGWDRANFSAIRVGVKLSPQAPLTNFTVNGRPTLDIRLLSPQKSTVDFTNSLLHPVGTAVFGELLEARFLHSEVIPIGKTTPNIQYSANILHYAFPNTPAADYWIQMRPANSLSQEGLFVVSRITEKPALTWFNIISGAGGLLSLLTLIFHLLFGNSKLRTWGPVQYVARREIIELTEEARARKESVEEKTVEKRLAELEALKDRLNEHYLEHGLFEPEVQKWYKCW